ncbi:hypothetical protein HK100_010707 [Physocladia obscura]|uniref:Protein kinase domain-containing protein n=1 Tax=Physocladia obscura TaxID=109957 RepID=A0AAD5TAH8_9FUNG|nr:hypothetical protein HK100_010707 [Physocladia obscura]
MTTTATATTTTRFASIGGWRGGNGTNASALTLKLASASASASSNPSLKENPGADALQDQDGELDMEGVVVSAAAFSGSNSGGGGSVRSYGVRGFGGRTQLQPLQDLASFPHDPTKSRRASGSASSSSALSSAFSKKGFVSFGKNTATPSTAIKSTSISTATSTLIPASATPDDIALINFNENNSNSNASNINNNNFTSVNISRGSSPTPATYRYSRGFTVFGDSKSAPNTSSNSLAVSAATSAQSSRPPSPILRFSAFGGISPSNVMPAFTVESQIVLPQTLTPPKSSPPRVSVPILLENNDLVDSEGEKNDDASSRASSFDSNASQAATTPTMPILPSTAETITTALSPLPTTPIAPSITTRAPSTGNSLHGTIRVSSMPTSSIPFSQLNPNLHHHIPLHHHNHHSYRRNSIFSVTSINSSRRGSAVAGIATIAAGSGASSSSPDAARIAAETLRARHNFLYSRRVSTSLRQFLSATTHDDKFLLPLRLLERYRFREALGQGATGFVVSAVRLRVSGIGDEDETVAFDVEENDRSFFAEDSIGSKEDQGQEIAIKFVFKDRVSGGWKKDFELGATVPMEVFVLRRLSHENIVGFHECFEDSVFIYIVMEAVKHISLLHSSTAAQNQHDDHPTSPSNRKSPIPISSTLPLLLPLSPKARATTAVDSAAAAAASFQIPLPHDIGSPLFPTLVKLNSKVDLASLADSDEDQANNNGDDDTNDHRSRRSRYTTSSSSSNSNSESESEDGVEMDRVLSEVRIGSSGGIGGGQRSFIVGGDSDDDDDSEAVGSFGAGSGNGGGGFTSGLGESGSGSGSGRRKRRGRLESVGSGGAWSSGLGITRSVVGSLVSVKHLPFRGPPSRTNSRTVVAGETAVSSSASGSNLVAVGRASGEEKSPSSVDGGGNSGVSGLHIPHPGGSSRRRAHSKDLFDYIERERQMGEGVAKFIFRQIAEAVKYLHGKGFVHRDIKDENVIIDDSMKVKLIDFGLAMRIPVDRVDYFTSFVGTMTYAPPECCPVDTGTPIDPYRGPEQDVWSLGVLLFVLLQSRPPYPPDSSRLARMMKPTLVGPMHRSEVVKDLLYRMLDPDPNTRINMNDVCAHSWLGGGVVGGNGVGGNGGGVPQRKEEVSKQRQHPANRAFMSNFGRPHIEQISIDIISKKYAALKRKTEPDLAVVSLYVKLVGGVRNGPAGWNAAVEAVNEILHYYRIEPDRPLLNAVLEMHIAHNNVREAIKTLRKIIMLSIEEQRDSSLNNAKVWDRVDLFSLDTLLILAQGCAQHKTHPKMRILKKLFDIVMRKRQISASRRQQIPVKFIGILITAHMRQTTVNNTENQPIFLITGIKEVINKNTRNMPVSGNMSLKKEHYAPNVTAVGIISAATAKKDSVAENTSYTSMIYIVETALPNFFGTKPNIVIYSTVLVNYSRTERIDNVMAWFGRMREISMCDHIAYNIVITALGKVGNIERMLEVYNELIEDLQSGQLSSVKDGDSKKIKRWNEFYGRETRNGEKIQSDDDNGLHNLLLLDTEKSAHLFARKMLLVTYATMTDAFVKVGNFGKIVWLHHEIEKFGITPNEISLMNRTEVGGHLESLLSTATHEYGAHLSEN